MISGSGNARRGRLTPLYTIGTAARLCGLPVYTLRWLELNGLVLPARTAGRQRLYCERDMELLAEISVLLGCQVNLQGIRVVLEIKGFVKAAAKKGPRRA